jgi:hypothetical protein
MSRVLLGVDFTSSPSPRKPITVARGRRHGEHLALEHIAHLADWQGFEALLREPGPWIAAFDFPFGLPRQAVADLGWPQDWAGLVRHCACLSRARLRELLDTYRATRAAGDKYPHRATDLPAGSHSPLKLVNPPVALMFHEGAPRLLQAGLSVPGLYAGDDTRVALEAYPGLTVRAITREPYKNDAPSKQTAARREARVRIVSALRAGQPIGIRLRCSSALDRRLLDDASGDSLDAVVCAMQAAWAEARAEENFGLPVDIDPLEGWIVTAGPDGEARHTGARMMF